MDQITNYRYEVATGEIVTITVTPVRVGSRVRAVKDRKALTNSGPRHTPRFKFKVDKLIRNSHRVRVVCNFVAADPSTGHYVIKIRGSRGGTFVPFKISKGGAIHEPHYRFKVVS